MFFQEVKERYDRLHVFNSRSGYAHFAAIKSIHAVGNYLWVEIDDLLSGTVKGPHKPNPEGYCWFGIAYHHYSVVEITSLLAVMHCRATDEFICMFVSEQGEGVPARLKHLPVYLQAAAIKRYQRLQIGGPDTPNPGMVPAAKRGVA